MKVLPVVLTVLLACLAYEADRALTLAETLETAQVIRPWRDERAADAEETDRGPALLGTGDGSRSASVGGVETPKSIRLFGPGISRRQQIRI